MALQTVPLFDGCPSCFDCLVLKFIGPNYVCRLESEKVSASNMELTPIDAMDPSCDSFFDGGKFLNLLALVAWVKNNREIIT